MRKTIAERGKFKNLISTALFKSENICDLLLGKDAEKEGSEKLKLFKEHVKSHLFIDDTIKETGSYIFYDVKIPYIHSYTKKCQILCYAIVHRDILDDGYFKKNYYGNRADILAEFIEECILSEDNIKEFGIGDITLDSLDIYNSKDFYGSIMLFSTENFR